MAYYIYYAHTNTTMSVFAEGETKTTMLEEYSGVRISYAEAVHGFHLKNDTDLDMVILLGDTDMFQYMIDVEGTSYIEFHEPRPTYVHDDDFGSSNPFMDHVVQDTPPPLRRQRNWIKWPITEFRFVDDTLFIHTDHVVYKFHVIRQV